MSLLEISDLVAAWDPLTGRRRPVRRDDVLARLHEAGDRRGARIEPRQEDLGEPPRHVQFLGCGLGFLIRSLAATEVLGADVELVGVDPNPALVAEATRLAADEQPRCTFLRADAFTLAEPATVYLSNGVLHHFPADALSEFFRAQDRAGAQGFIHYDIAATRLAPLGAWIFHRARMREPLGRHDGVMSARRAHPDSVLVSASGAAHTHFCSSQLGTPTPAVRECDRSSACARPWSRSSAAPARSSFWSAWGPVTLIRPVVVVAGVTVWSVVGSGDWLVWWVAIAAALSILAVEPMVHRRWYRTLV